MIEQCAYELGPVTLASAPPAGQTTPGAPLGDHPSRVAGPSKQWVERHTASGNRVPRKRFPSDNRKRAPRTPAENARRCQLRRARRLGTPAPPPLRATPAPRRAAEATIAASRAFHSGSKEYRRAYGLSVKYGLPMPARRALKAVAKVAAPPLNDPQKRMALAARGQLPASRWGDRFRGARGVPPPGAMQDKAKDLRDATFGKRAAALAAHTHIEDLWP